MKNAIRILLYLLLALLVVAISVIIYKRSKTPVDDVPTTAEMADSLFMDQNQGNQTALNSEDSMILDMTGQLPSQVGAPAKSAETASSEPKPVENKTTDPKTAENKSLDKKQVSAVTSAPSNNMNIDYSQPIGPTEPMAAVNTNPKAQKVSDHSSKASPAPALIKSATVHKVESEKSATKTTVAKSTKTKSNAAKATNTKSTSSKSTAKTSTNKSGTFYVVSGSFIVPGHADDQVKKLKKLGYKNASRKVFGSSEYYCAVAGKYNSRDEAEKIVHKLTSKGVNAFLKTK